jgi:hypothetical protein
MNLTDTPKPSETKSMPWSTDTTQWGAFEWHKCDNPVRIVTRGIEVTIIMCGCGQVLLHEPHTTSDCIAALEREIADLRAAIDRAMQPKETNE